MPFIDRKFNGSESRSGFGIIGDVIVNNEQITLPTMPANERGAEPKDIEELITDNITYVGSTKIEAGENGKLIVDGKDVRCVILQNPSIKRLT